MAYRKTWTVRVPVLPGADDEDTLLPVPTPCCRTCSCRGTGRALTAWHGAKMVMS